MATKALQNHPKTALTPFLSRSYAEIGPWNFGLGEAERLGMGTHFAALTQSLAAYAQNTRKFAEAGRLFEALAEQRSKTNDAKTEAAAYHQLGMIAQEQRNFATAEQWYRKSLAIAEKQGDEHCAAGTYHQLGRIAEEQRDFAAAEQWYRKSLAIAEKQDNEHGAAITYHQRGVLAGVQERFRESGEWLIKSLTSFRRANDPHYEQQAASNFLVFYGRASDDDKAELRRMWEQAGLGPFPEQAREAGN